MSKVSDKPEHVLLFDGVCNLCNAVVQFVLRHDDRDRLKFASLQSSYGQATLSKLDHDPEDLQSFIYYRSGTYHKRSNGFLYLMRDLGGWFRLFEVLWIVPRSIRDWVYNGVARSRYSIFGKREECYLPSKDLSNRFVDELSPTE